MIRILMLFTTVGATPAFAATGPFFSLYNTNFVVTISFLIFVGVIIYLKVPQFVGKLLDKQIGEIRSQIDKAAKLREEADKSLEKANIEAEESVKQAELIIDHAKSDAEQQISEAEVRIKEAGERRVQAAIEQMASAEKAAQNAVYSQSVELAVEMAAKEIVSKMTDSERSSLTEKAVQDIRANMH